MGLSSRDYLQVEGRLSPASVANPGFTRLYGTNVEQFVELNQIDIVPGSGPFQPNQLAIYEIPIESRLALSGFPPLPGPLPLPKPIHVRIPELAHPPVFPKYLASDGTVLTATGGPSANQITEFSGTGKDGHAYDLSVQTKVITGAGRTAVVTGKSPTSDGTVKWFNATVSITKDKDTPLTFGFSYCPWANLMWVTLSRGPVKSGIRIDLIPQTPTSNYVALARTFSFHDYVYTVQTQNMGDGVADPAFYLPAVATLWPFLDRVEFFGPALHLISALTAGSLPQAQIPISPFVTLSLKYPITEPAFVNAISTAVGTALGSLVASFVSPTESQVAALKDAALWLGWIAINGVGKTNFANELSYFYQQATAWFKHEPTQSSSVPLKTYKPLPAPQQGAPGQKNPQGGDTFPS
jgi:hypothetical protein